LISIFSLVTIAIPTNLGINDIGLGLLLMSILPSSLAAVIAVLFYLLALLYEFMFMISKIKIIRECLIYLISISERMLKKRFSYYHKIIFDIIFQY